MGPLQITGVFGSSRIRLIDMTLIPVFVEIGIIPPGPLVGRSLTPKTLAMLGPVRTASRTPTSYPSLLSWLARKLVTNDFPTPHFPETMAIMFLTRRFPRRSIPWPTLALSGPEVFGLVRA